MPAQAGIHAFVATDQVRAVALCPSRPMIRSDRYPDSGHGFAFTQLRLRDLTGAKAEFLLAATVQNLKNLSASVPTIPCNNENLCTQESLHLARQMRVWPRNLFLVLRPDGTEEQKCERRGQEQDQHDHAIGGNQRR